jgi:predicted signal transduction protein with EAL and GGDEF domain
VARVSGDEFVIVCPDVNSADEVAATAQRILTAFSVPFELSAAEITCTPSIGITFHPSATGPVTGDDLLIEADAAMYAAKAAGRRGAAVYDESMAGAAAHRAGLENDLRTALARGELAMHYQPVVDLHAGRTAGFEALMRWNHPVRGSVPPDEFIVIAEETGMISELGAWALDTAAGQLALFHCIDESLTMSVNVSARQLRDPEFAGMVAGVLGRHRLPARNMFLEITETSVIADAAHADLVFADLKKVGVRLSTDDFGTGYSSLAFLRRFPIDQVKIDKSFVSGIGSDVEDEVIIAAIVSMSTALDLSIVAEGVETPEQRDRLAQLGCDRGQGWLFAKALPAGEASSFLNPAAAAGKPAG